MTETTTADSDSSSRTATNRIPETDLLEYLQTFSEELGRVPRSRDMRRCGEYSAQTYYNRFASWVDALKQAGLYDEFVPSKYDGAEHQLGTLIDELVRVATVVGRPPTEDDLDEFGEFSHSAYQSTFGSWAEALRTCGFSPRYRGGTALPPDLRRTTYGHNWDEQRRRALFRDGHQCQRCGVTIDETGDRPHAQLQVHHIVPIRRFNEPEVGNHLLNLITLCPECHRIWEASGPTDIDPEKLAAEIRESAESQLS